MGGNRMTEHADLTDVKQDLATLKEDVADLVSGVTASGIHLARQRAEGTVDSMREMAAQTRDKAREAHGQLGDTVSRRPITSLAIAFGLGAITARIISR